VIIANIPSTAAERYADFWASAEFFGQSGCRPSRRSLWTVWRLIARPMARHAGYFLGGRAQADAVEVTLLDAQGRTVGQPVSVPGGGGPRPDKNSRTGLWTGRNAHALYAGRKTQQCGPCCTNTHAAVWISHDWKSAREQAVCQRASASCSRASVITSRGRRWTHILRPDRRAGTLVCFSDMNMNAGAHVRIIPPE